MELNLGKDTFLLTDPWRASLFSADTGAEPTLFPSPNFDREFVASINTRVFCALTSEIVNLTNLDNPYAPENKVGEELKLPDLETFRYGPLEDIPLPDESVGTTDDWKSDERGDEIEDVWGLVMNHSPVGGDIKFKTWEVFQEAERVEPCSAYLSEAGPLAFDAALRIHGRDKAFAATSVIKSDVFLKSVFALGLGRSSSLFRYDAQKRDFQQIISEGTISGYSNEVCQSLISKIMNCGSIIRHLREYTDRTYTSGKAFPARVALANSISSIIDALELHLTSSSEHLGSMLQIQCAFERPHRLFKEVYDLVKSLRNSRSNEELASAIFRRCQNCDQEPEWLRAMMLQILARVARPWLEVAEQWVGFQDDTGSLFSKDQEPGIFVSRDDPPKSKPEDDKETREELQYTYRPERLPSFISPEDGQMMFDIGRDIRILRMHHPEHPLAQTAYAQKHDISLRWHFGWQDADHVMAKARSFELALAIAVKKFTDNAIQTEAEPSDLLKNSELATTVVSPGPFAFEGMELFRTTSRTSNQLPDELFEIITASLSLEPGSDLVDFSPPTAITPILSFNPLLAAQQRLINAVMIRMFFRKHSLRMHIDLQRSYHLLGDGVFVSRLTAALFDPNQSSTERERGVMRGGSGMGLRLGSRGTWPPASSELRLALMGILNECFQASFRKYSQDAFATCNHDLPGSLSFAIRQLSEEEAEKILNADSLHALDFLRMQYSSPSPLGAILTPSSLERYDTIFKFLLRLERLLFVISHLPRNLASPKASFFRLQAEHFVSTCCRYFFDTGVTETWTVFMKYLDNVEKRLAEEDEVGELGTRVFEGIEDIRKQHDLCIDRITFALLLRNRQQKVMAVLEDILNTVLEFSKLCNATEDAGMDAVQIRKLQRGFNEKVKLFLDVCRGLVGKKGYGKSGGEGRGAFGGKGTTGEENTIERLVIALDYNGFYERHG